MLGICRLRNQIQPYDWGSRTALAELLGRQAPAAGREAELWMGAHPKAPSEVEIAGRWVPLPDAVRERPEAILGARAVARHGAELPFLFKVLAVARPLSIQAHPDRRQAAAGFRREEDAGIPRDARERNYRDDRPKPEIVYALTPFSMLRGFRPLAEIRELVGRFGLAALLPECEALATQTDEDGLRKVCRAWLELPRERLDEILTALLARCRELEEEEVAMWILRLAEACPGDVGVLAPLFLNLHRLAPGEAVFTGPGVLHAYLEGLGIELMTSSDNVLRGGLTSKHRDVEELLRVLRFAPDRPRLVEPARGAGVARFTVPGVGFELAVLEPQDGRSIAGDAERGVEIFLCTAGAGLLTTADGAPFEFRRGDSFLVPAAAGPYRLTGSGHLFRAGVAP